MPRKRRTPPALLAAVLSVIALALAALSHVTREDGGHPRAAAGPTMVRLL